MPKILKKLDSKGKIRIWLAEASGDQIIVTHGLDDGQLITETTTAKPKNTGRSNATSAEQQAEAEVKALYAKKLARDGYKENLDDPDTFVAPMLARDYSKLAHQVPDTTLFISRKLDGVRCIWDPVKKALVSRKGVAYKVPHIEALLRTTEKFLDGELYIHGYPLNELVSAVKKPNDLTPFLEYHVFDVVEDLPFQLRKQIYESRIGDIDSHFVKAVTQTKATKDSVKQLHDNFILQGFEGAMIRVPEYSYEIGIRSKSLYKYKEFEEAEYLITDVIEDKEGGAVLGCSIGKDLVVTQRLLNAEPDFKVRCRGTDAYRQDQLAKRSELIGKLVTVRYQTLTPFGIPQFPVGIAIRDYE